MALSAKITGMDSSGSTTMYQIEVTNTVTGRTWLHLQRYSAFLNLHRDINSAFPRFPEKKVFISDREKEDRKLRLNEFLQHVLSGVSTLSTFNKLRVAEFLGTDGSKEPSPKEAADAATKLAAAVRGQQSRRQKDELVQARQAEAAAKGEQELKQGAEEQRKETAALNHFHDLMLKGTEVWKQPRSGKPHKRVLFLDGKELKLGKSKQEPSKTIALADITSIEAEEQSGEKCWFTIKYPERNFVLGVESPRVRDWMVANLATLKRAFANGVLVSPGAASATTAGATAAPPAAPGNALSSLQAADGTFSSSFDAVDIPANMSLPAFVLSKMNGAGTALIDGPSGRQVTYSELAAQIKKLASALNRLGIKKGDVFAIFMPNCPEYAVAFHGVAAAGGIVTTINPQYKQNEVEHQLKDANAKYLLTTDDFLAVGEGAVTSSGLDIEIIVHSQYTTSGARVTLGSLLDDDAGAWAQCEAIEFDAQNDIVALPYSSGTTGLPKGVMLTHHNIVANLCQCMHRDLVKLTSTDTLIGVLPFFHIYGMVIILNVALASGATIVTMPRFEPMAFLKNIEEHKVTVAHLVPPLVLFLAKNPVVDQFDLSSVKEVLCGAAPLGDELTRAISSRLNLERVRQGYGMTELSPASHISPYVGAVPGSIGKLLPNMKLKIVDTESGKLLGEGQDGEICVSGPNVMKGYLNNQEATDHTIRDGFLHTGDIGHVDRYGHYFIVDRVKELIKYKGFQVAPAELESILQGHPAVADAAVVPKEDVEAGELPIAFVVKKPDAAVTEDEVKEFVKSKVASYKQLRGVNFTEEIPKSASGKILRRVLREQLKTAS